VALYAYRAFDAEGRSSNGHLDAANPVDLELRLRRLGLDLITCDPVRRSAAARSRQVTRAELITFCFHLSQLLNAGVSIIEALTDLRDSVDNPGFRQVVASVLEDIEGGLKLSEAMANHPYCFDSVFVALMRAGEQSGQLTQVLDQLADNIKWQDEIAAQARRALTYPTVVLAVIMAVVFILMTVLVPQLAATFKTLVPKLPRETEILVFISNALMQHWYLVLGIPAVIALAAWSLARTNQRVQRALDELALRLPVLGGIRQKIILARFSTIFALLYKSGISVLDCLRISEMQRVGRNISEGHGISQAFVATKLFPPLVLRMLRVGESTGGLDAALMNVSYFYNRQVRDSVDRLQQLMGPATTIVLGLLIAAILYSIFLPIYDVLSKVKF
jgi:type IV pilus assembly protein PilC